AGLPGVGVHGARNVRRRGRGAPGRRADGGADRHVGTRDAPPLPAGHGRSARAAELLRRPPRGAHGADAHREVGVRHRAHRPLVRRVARPDRGGRLQRHRRQRRLPRRAAPLPQRGRRHGQRACRHVPRGGADVVRHPDRPRAGARGGADHPFRGPPGRGQRPPRGAGRDQPADGLREAALQDDPVIPASAPPSPVARLKVLAGGWRDPQSRDGMALVLSSAISSAVGMLYWVVAARMFDPATVGVNTTVVSTLGLLGIIAQLNLGSAMLRFVPVVGRGARALVAACYATGIGAALVIGTGFALGAGWWAPELQAAVGAGALVAYFVVATPFWTVFNMQDYLLTGIKRARIVPFENLGFALLKIVLLVVGGLLGFSGAVAGSWALGTAVT